tara:strand:+ start:273 stop:377 length:105 start_codon:yes stop_codon:yes gene_type:complete
MKLLFFLKEKFEGKFEKENREKFEGRQKKTLMNF